MIKDTSVKQAPRSRFYLEHVGKNQQQQRMMVDTGCQRCQQCVLWRRLVSVDIRTNLSSSPWAQEERGHQCEK